MFEPLDVTRIAQALAAHSGERLSLIAENVANADTPGYRARDLPDFAAAFQAGDLSLRQTRSGHIAGGASLPAVVLAEGDVARRRELAIGIRGTGEVEVLSGLPEEARVIAPYPDKLGEGARIRLRDQ